MVQATKGNCEEIYLKVVVTEKESIADADLTNGHLNAACKVVIPHGIDGIAVSLQGKQKVWGKGGAGGCGMTRVSPRISWVHVLGCCSIFVASRVCGCIAWTSWIWFPNFPKLLMLVCPSKIRCQCSLSQSSEREMNLKGS